MKKIILITFFSLLSINVYSIELKLQCQSSYQYLMNGRIDESKNGLLIVEIQDSSNYKSILTSGLDTISVSTSSLGKLKNKTIQDFSDDSKWDITNFYVLSNGIIKTTTVNIRIDRDIGSIHIKSNSEFVSGNFSELTITGTCKKTDKNQKKF